ncbi:MAG: hypothetical protein H0U74_21910 [Bradymonadaceae bacterium]|nr:hypothetical protein [Lujinxingiaceae bacterium]
MSNDEQNHRKRGGSYYTEGERKTKGKPQSQSDKRSSASYKSDLERLFDTGGDVPERFQGMIDGLKPKAGTPEADRLEAIEQMKKTESFREFVEAINAFRLKGYGMPDDEDLLARMLDHPSERVAIEVLRHLLDLNGRRKLQRLTPIKSRLPTLRSMSDDPAIHALIATLEKL